jgi:hypothetical protein
MTSDKRPPKHSGKPEDDLALLHERIQHLEAKLERLRKAVRTHLESLDRKRK